MEKKLIIGTFEGCGDQGGENSLNGDNINWPYEVVV